jgi:uncharacterized cupredoxin-like copper-binding protein
MGKRLVCKIEGGSVDFGEFEKFIATAKNYGVKKAAVMTVSASEKGHRVTLTVDVPNDTAVVAGEPVKVKKKTKKQEKVEKQIQEHKEKKKNGEDEAYVPPVGRKTAPKQQKVKCPECNVRKPVVTVAGQKVLKPHTVKGEECPGSGLQIVKQSKSASQKVAAERVKEKE